MASILVPPVGKFLKSDTLLKLPNGKERAELTVKKTVRLSGLLLPYSWAIFRLNESIRSTSVSVSTGRNQTGVCERLMKVFPAKGVFRADYSIGKQ